MKEIKKHEKKYIHIKKVIFPALFVGLIFLYSLISLLYVIVNYTPVQGGWWVPGLVVIAVTIVGVMILLPGLIYYRDS